MYLNTWLVLTNTPMAVWQFCQPSLNPLLWRTARRSFIHPSRPEHWAFQTAGVQSSCHPEASLILSQYPIIVSAHARHGLSFCGLLDDTLYLSTWSLIPPLVLSLLWLHSWTTVLFWDWSITCVGVVEWKKFQLYHSRPWLCTTLDDTHGTLLSPGIYIHQLMPSLKV